MKFSDCISMVVAASVALSGMSTAVQALEAAAITDVNVRSGPGVRFGKVDVLREGEVVDITECRGNWCYVIKPGPDGWVSGRYLQALEGVEDAAGADEGGGSENARRSGGGDAAAAAILGAIVGGVLADRAAKRRAEREAAAREAEEREAEEREAAEGGTDRSLEDLGLTPLYPADPVVRPDLPYGPDTCKEGYVWREARPEDHVCVRPARRAQAQRENALASSRRHLFLGSYRCIPGFVERKAFPGDNVCVTPERRRQVAQENREGPRHRVLSD